MQVRTNSSYRITGYDATINPTWRQKLLAVGMLPGALIEVIRVAPMGDPLQIRIKHLSLAVRQEDLASVQLEEWNT